MATDSETTTTAAPLSLGLWFRLSLMMFLQYAIWGAWLPLLFPFLAGHRGFSPGQIGDMFAVGALGAILAPWIAGQIADRYFNTERYLAVAHILGGILVFQLAWLSDYWAFLGCSFLYSLIYAPTLSLTNSISFHHLPDRDRDFGRVRVWGTVGWIVVGVGVAQWLAFNHSPAQEEATRGMIVELLDEENREQLKEMYEVKYTDEAGDVQTVMGTADPLDFAYLDAFARGAAPAEHKVILINRGSKAEPDFLPIETENLVAASNKFRDLQNTLQPELIRDFYAQVDKTAGREVQELSEQEVSPDGGGAAPGGGGASAASAAVTLPVPWIPEDEKPLDFADRVAKEFETLGDFEVISKIDRRTEVSEGEPVLLEMGNGTFINRVLVQRAASGIVVRNPDSGRLEVYGGLELEGLWSPVTTRVVGKVVGGESPNTIGIIPRGETEAERVSEYDIVSREPYGLFRKSAIKAYVAKMEQAGMSDAFILSSVLGIVLGLFCLTLPKTPPQPGRQTSATSEALGEIRHQPLLALFLLAVPISCIHQFYFVHASTFLGEYQRTGADFVEWMSKIFGVGGGGLMTIGQMTEIAVLAFMPIIAKKASRKSLLATGIIAYGLRMFLFAYVEVIPLPHLLTLILGVALHGVCFGCFIFVAFMIVDEETTGDVRASAQSLFNLVIVGVGIIVGSKIAGWVAEWASASGAMDYKQLFSVPMWASVGCLAFLIFFYPRKSKHRTLAEQANS